MRNLKTSDVFSASRIIKELDLKEKIKDIALNSKNIDQRVVGFDIVWTIIENACTKKAEALVYEFIGNLLEKTPDEIAEMNPTEMLTDLLEVANLEEWKSFFKYVSQMIRQK